VLKEMFVMRRKKGSFNLNKRHYGAVLFLGVIVVALVVNAGAGFTSFNINDDFGFDIVIDDVVVGSFDKDDMAVYEVGPDSGSVNFDIFGPTVGITGTEFDRDSGLYPEVGITLSSFRTVQDIGTGVVGEEGIIDVFNSETSGGIITDYYKVRIRIRVSTFAGMISTSPSVIYEPDLGGVLNTTNLPEDGKMSMVLKLGLTVSNPTDVAKGVLGLYSFGVVDNPVGIDDSSFIEARFDPIVLSSWGAGIGEIPREAPYAGAYVDIISTDTITSAINGVQSADITIPIEIGAGGYFDGSSWVVNDATLAIETEMLFGLSYSQYNTAKLSWIPGLGFLVDAFPTRLAFADIREYVLGFIILSVVLVVLFGVLYWGVLKKRVVEWES